jgi:hypothetical protein
MPSLSRGSARVSYSLPSASNYTLELYDITGSRVLTLARGHAPAGRYTHRLEVGKLARGIYLLRLETADSSLTRKLVLIGTHSIR